MTDYTKLVQALRCKRDDCEGCDLAFLDKDEGWMCQYAAKDDDAADAIEALQAASPWHKVEDELPPKATWVLTVATDGNVKLFNIATVDAGGQWWTCSPQNILRELFGVRYWMPIEPPQEDA